MKALKIILILFAVYVGIVVIFESLLGYFQPAGAQTLLIVTTNDDGNEASRVLSPIESGGKLYVAANHWPRGWFRNVQQRPNVRATLNGETNDYVAMLVAGAEDEQLRTDFAHGIVFRLLTGFPPRYFVRLDPLGS